MGLWIVRLWWKVATTQRSSPLPPVDLSLSFSLLSGGYHDKALSLSAIDPWWFKLYFQQGADKDTGVVDKGNPKRRDTHDSRRCGLGTRAAHIFSAAELSSSP